MALPIATAASASLLLLLLLGGSLVTSSPLSSEPPAIHLPVDASETYQAHIWTLLDALNSNPDRQYNYNFGQLLEAQRKSDEVTALTFEVDAECFAYASCPSAVLVCSGHVEHVPSSSRFDALPGVECKRKTDEGIAPSKAASCPGCSVDLNVDVPGVETLVDTALQHLESERSSKHLLVRVLRLQREIVAGVKFVLLLEVRRADAPDGIQVCRIEYMQKPWVSSDKHIIANNCTASQAFPAVGAKKARAEVDNEIDVHNEYKMAADMQDGMPDGPNYDKMAETGNLEEMGEAKALADIEAQVIQTRALQPQPQPQLAAVAATQVDVDSAQMVVEDVPALHSTASSYAAGESKEDESLGSSEERPKRDVEDDSSHSSASKDSQEVGVRRKRSPTDDDDDKEKHTKRKKVKSCGGSSGDDDDDDGDYECPKKKKKPFNCNNSDDVVPNDDDDDDENAKGKCSKSKSKKLKKPRRGSSSSGSSSSSSDEDGARRRRRDVQLDALAERVFVDRLAAFAAERMGDARTRYEPLEVLRVKKMELEGAVYHMVVRLATRACSEAGECHPGGDDQLCKVQVHASKDRRALKLLKTRCHAVEHGADKQRRRRREAVGAPAAVSKDDATIKALAKQALVQLDAESPHANKLKVVEVIEAKKQVVAGILYVINVEIAETDCDKTSDKDAELCGEKEHGVRQICHIRIWDRPWLANGRETNTTCEDAKSKPVKRSLDAPRDADLLRFWAFADKYGKAYSEREAAYRFRVFTENMRKAAELQKYEQGTATYGASRFADLNAAEFRQYLGYRPELRDEDAPPFASARIPDLQPPTEFDWRTKNAVAEVKDQGQCGSCWAFSVTGNVEGQYAIKHGELREFSEQELVDCDRSDDGCNGGLMDTAYRAIEQLGGLEQEKDYPYDAEDETCKFKKSKVAVQLTGALNISQDEGDMAKWLVQNGPIAIAINANAMQFYMGGVSHPPKFLCHPEDLDHGVLIVGYGVHQYKLFNKSLPFWIVKNSWGRQWGEQGYYRVYRGDGTCGLNQTPSSAIVA